jgi:hypothetical protein
MRLIVIFTLFFSFSGVSQHDFETWTKAGFDYKIKKGIHAELELNSRFDDQGLATFFPQLGLEYKLTKWLKPSIEYRFVLDRNKIGNYKPYSRLNFNLNFGEDIDRFSLGARIRYQYAFNSLSQGAYDADFDMAFRFKPSVKYDINDFPLSPEASVEVFYNPLAGGPYRPGLDKVRYAVGVELDKKGPHGAGIKYQLDHKLHDYNANIRHVIALSYSFDIN